jgi:hypothetical protein
MDRDPLCSECLFGRHQKHMEPTSPCGRCLSHARRPNFVSIFRDGERRTERKRKGDRPKKGDRPEGRIPRLVRSASEMRRSISVRKARTWDLLMSGRPDVAGRSVQALFNQSSKS